MLGAFARASAVLGDEKYRAAAEKNLEFIREKLWDRRNATEWHLFHRWRDGERDRVQLLEGYAFLLVRRHSILRGHAGAGAAGFCRELAEAMLAKFYDPANGGFWQSPAGADDLILRVKDDYDGAEPSGNSVATLALLKLAAITGREDFRQPAEATLQLFAARLQKQPAALAVPAARGGFLAGRTAPRGHRRRRRIPRSFTNCSAPRMRFISRIKLCWATPARSSHSPKL